MKNRDGSESNGYVGSSNMLEDIEAYGKGCWKPLGHKWVYINFGLILYCRILLEQAFKVLHLRMRISNHYRIQKVLEGDKNGTKEKN